MLWYTQFIIFGTFERKLLYLRIIHLQSDWLQYVSIVGIIYTTLYFETFFWIVNKITIDTLFYGQCHSSYQTRFKMHWDSKILLNYHFKRGHFFITDVMTLWESYHCSHWFSIYKLLYQNNNAQILWLAVRIVSYWNLKQLYLVIVSYWTLKQLYLVIVSHVQWVVIREYQRVISCRLPTLITII
jgi:hypothetical protein